MKRILLVFVLVIICITCTACTTEERTNNLTLDYNKETRECVLTNISDYDYEELELTLIVCGKDGFQKKIKEIVGTLYKGEEYSFKLSGVDEEIQIKKVMFESYSYYYNWFLDFLKFFGIITILIIIGIIACILG